MKSLFSKLLALLLFLCLNFAAFSQEQGSLMYLDTAITKKILNTIKKYEYVGISGYIQPQFQVIETKGAKSFNGGNFPDNVANRFMLRRGRIRFDYAKFTADNYPKIQFVFQFDGTERGVNIRDFWGKIYDTKFHNFAITTGMFARPFGYELNLSSSDRESPERGRMSQILMKTERDLGVMLSYEPRKASNKFNKIRYEIGVFNGQGLGGTFDYDSHKDLISRLSLKPLKISPKITFSSSVSALIGGLLQPNGLFYTFSETQKSYVLADKSTYKNNIAPRTYLGADAQLKIKNKVGFSEFRAEYIAGTQSALKASTETPGSLPTEPIYVRNFNGAYFYYLQNLASTKHQLLVKCDWYDPNTQIKQTDINSAHTWAEIKYTTVGAGYVYYVNPNLKVVGWFEKPINEQTNLPDYKADANDNSFTMRVQYRF